MAEDLGDDVQRRSLGQHQLGMSSGGAVITGWGALARTEEEARQAVQDLIDGK